MKDWEGCHKNLGCGDSRGLCCQGVGDAEGHDSCSRTISTRVGGLAATGIEEGPT